MAIYKLADKVPTVHESSYVAEQATVIGDVTLEQDTSVWFGAVIRADIDHIHIGVGTNIQEGAVLHVDFGYPLTLGPNVTIGHQAMLHGCTVGENSLIGIQAVVLNGAVIGKNCLVGAGSLVTEGKTFPDNCLILGSPAKAVRELTPEQIEGLKLSAHHYSANARLFGESLERIE